jgi:hypothetical protein
LVFILFYPSSVLGHFHRTPRRIRGLTVFPGDGDGAGVAGTAGANSCGRARWRTASPGGTPPLDGLVRIVKRKLKKIHYRPDLIGGWPAGTGLAIGPW